MTQQEFQKYVPILQQEPFTFYPAVDTSAMPSRAHEWYTKRFRYAGDSETHVIVEECVTSKTYYIPLVLVEFANPGILRLTRALKPDNGGLL
jgi:hypothetical protein